MQARWLDEDHTTVAVTLADGERLGNQTGPGFFSIPATDGNADYAALIESGVPIEEPA
jgi:hypothetical protein